MHIGIKYCIILILLLFGVGLAHSQDICTGGYSYLRADGDVVGSDTLNGYVRINKQYQNIEVHFKFDKYNLELDYMGNRASLQRFSHKIDSIGLSHIDSIVIVSQSSPEGVYEHNLMLSRNRANTMREYILSTHPELRDILYVYPDGESWLRLREYVKRDSLMKNSTIEEVVSIIDADINMVTKKLRMEQLPIYRYLITTYYPRIRNSLFCILYYSKVFPIVAEPELDIDVVDIDIDDVVPDTIPPMILELEDWTRRLHLKTNVVGLSLGIANMAVEVDLFKHCSFTVPVYYSAWNYFKSTIKFRTFSFQPEFRYWLSPNNDGLFAGAHFGLTYYNFAFDGDYRYQDHNRVTPAIGGGVSVGYRLPISKNNRWRMELSLGVGAYSNHYDKFYNTPNTKDGLIIESVNKTYWGIDQATISFSYSFEL